MQELLNFILDAVFWAMPVVGVLVVCYLSYRWFRRVRRRIRHKRHKLARARKALSSSQVQNPPDATPPATNGPGAR